MAKMKTYRVLNGIDNVKLGVRHEPGKVVQLDPSAWNIEWLLRKGHVEVVKEKEVSDGNGEDA